MRQAFGGSDRGLGQGSGQGGGVTVLHNDPARAEGQGRAEDGPHVLGVGQLVQHDDHALRGFGQVLQGHAFQRLDLEGQALVHRPGRQHAGQGLGIDRLDAMAVGQIAGLDLGRALGRGQQPAGPAPDGIRQSGQDGVPPPEEIVGIDPASLGAARGTRRLFAGRKPFAGGLFCPVSRRAGAAGEGLFFTAFTVVAF